MYVCVYKYIYMAREIWTNIQTDMYVRMYMYTQTSTYVCLLVSDGQQEQEIQCLVQRE